MFDRSSEPTAHTGGVSEDPDDPVRAGINRVLYALYPRVTITTNDDGSATGTAEYWPEPEHQGAVGWVHGGLSATVIDFVSARTAKVALSSRVATGTFDLRYRGPLKLDGGPYEVTASTNEPTGRTVRVKATFPFRMRLWSRALSSSSRSRSGPSRTP